MKAKLIFTCLFLMVLLMNTAIYVRGQTTSDRVFNFDYGLLYPAPGEPRVMGAVAPHVKWEKKTGKILYGVRADSVELDSLTFGYQRAWSLEVRSIRSNVVGQSDSVTFRRRETGYTGAVTYTDTALFFQNNTQLLDVWPGIDLTFYDSDSMAVHDVVLIYLINRKFIKHSQEGYTATESFYRLDSLTISEADTLFNSNTAAIFTRAFPGNYQYKWVSIKASLVHAADLGVLGVYAQIKPHGINAWGGSGLGSADSLYVIQDSVHLKGSNWWSTFSLSTLPACDSVRLLFAPVTNTDSVSLDTTRATARN